MAVQFKLLLFVNVQNAPASVLDYKGLGATKTKLACKGNIAAAKAIIGETYEDHRHSRRRICRKSYTKAI